MTPEPTGGFTIEAAPDGTTAGAYRGHGVEGGPFPPPTSTHHVYGLGWPGDATDAGPKTATFADQGDAGLPPVDADGNGFGWTAYIDGDNNLHIVRFSLANPSAAISTWEIPAVAEDPGEFSGDATESREDPHIDVNAAGDVIVSFVEARRRLNSDGFSPPVNAVCAVRKLNGKDPGEAFQISHEDESEAVDEHDPAIADNADVTVLFASDPERNTQDPSSSGPQRVYARRWLATATGPRNPEGGIELVSSSDEAAPDVSRLRAEAGPDGRVTAAWSQGAQLNSAERFGTWTLPETLSNNTAAFDIAVDVAGVATVVYRENTVVRARRRTAGQKWAAAEAISTGPVPTDFTPKVDAGKENQADAYVLQTVGTRRAAFATRFTGAAPVEPPAPFKPDTLDCPGDVVENVSRG